MRWRTRLDIRTNGGDYSKLEVKPDDALVNSHARMHSKMTGS